MSARIVNNKDVIIGSLIFLGGVVVSVILGISLIIPLALGYMCYAFIAKERGYSQKQIGSMTFKGAKESVVVVSMLLLIGAVSAAWRASGTIAIFVHYGLNLISPGMFLLLAFLICCAFSYALGSCFGTAGTIGIILITLAKAGDVSVVMTAGAVLSGGYFGDRCSPVSASASLTAFVTKTNLYDNVRMMFKTMGVPFAITTAMYGVLSFTHPLAEIDPAMDNLMVSGYHLSPVLLLPVVVMLALPLLKVNIKITALISIGLSIILAVGIQGESLTAVLKSLFFGYAPADDALAGIFAGGGMMSMINICGIVLIACSYSGIINGTGMFKDVAYMMGRACRKIGRVYMTFLTGTVFSGMFCSCSAAIIMSNMVLGQAYESTGGDKQELAIDIENTVELTATWVPWSAACMASFSAMAVPGTAIFFSFYVFILPIHYLISKSHKALHGDRLFVSQSA